VTTQDSLVTGNIEPHRFAPEYKGSEGFDDGDGRITPTSRSRQSGIPLEPRGIQRTTNAIGEGIVDVELEEVKEEDPCPHCRPAIQFTCRDCLRKQKIQENEDELKVSITRLSAPENAGDERSTRVPDDERERERVEGPGHSRDTSSNHRRTPDHLKPRQAGKGLASGRLGKTGKGSIRNPMLGSGKYNEKMFSSKMFLRVYYADEKKKHELYKANFNDPEQQSGIYMDGKKRFLRAVDGRIANSITAVIVLMAIILTTYTLFRPDMQGEWELNLLIFSIFAAELILRFFAYGYRSFFQRPMIWVDMAVIAADIVAIALDDSNIHAFRLLRVIRIARFGKVTRKWLYLQEDVGREDQEKVVADNGHVIWYMPRHLFSQGWLYSLRGTVAWSREIWVQAVMLLILSAVWGSRICKTGCQNCGRCTQAIGAVPVLVTTLVATVSCGIFILVTFRRWWNTRSKFAGVTGNVRDFIQMIVAYFPGRDELSFKFSDKIVRLQLAAFILLTQSLRGERDLKLLVDQGLLTYRERKRLRTVAGCYYLVYAWIRSEIWKFERAASDLFVSPSSSGVLCGNLERCLVKQQEDIDSIFTLLETQLPYIYVHLVTLIAKIQLIVVALWAGSLLRYGYDQEAYGTLVFGLLFVVFVNSLVEGMLQVHAALFSPFGYDAVNFPLHLYVRSIVSLSSQLRRKTYPIAKNPGQHRQQESHDLKSAYSSNPSLFGSGSKKRENPNTRRRRQTT